MYCKNCGKEIDNDAKFCPNCGTAAQQAPISTENSEAACVVEEDKPPKVWTVFSKIGKILGIVCLATSLIPYLNIFSLTFGIAGIVMSCLGRKAKTQETDNNCSLGLKLSIVAVAVSFVMIIVYSILFVSFLGSVFFYYY